MFFLIIFYSFSITLDSLINEGINNNWEIKIMAERYHLFKEKVKITGIFDYPQIGVEFRKGERMVSLMQMVPFILKIPLEKKSAEDELKIVLLEFHKKIFEIRARIKKIFWELWKREKTIESYKENIELMKRYLQIAQTLYSLGKTSQVDILKATIEISEMENMLGMLEEEKNAFLTELNYLLNRSGFEPLEKLEPPEFKEISYSLVDLEKLALENNWEIKIKEHLYQKNLKEVNLTKMKWVPDLMLGVGVNNMAQFSFMIKISLPVYFQKQLGEVKIMTKERIISEYELKEAKLKTLSELKRLFKKYETFKKIIENYEKHIIPLAKKLLTISEANYQLGKNDFLELLDTQRRYLAINIEYYKNYAEYNIILAELEKLIGIVL